MHAAPAVQITITADIGWRAVNVLLACAAAAVGVAWAALQFNATPGIAALCAGVAATVAGSCRAWCLARDPRATAALAWDGALWTWQAGAGESCVVEVQAMLDLGPWMLLRFVPGNGRIVWWQPASRRSTGAAWPALRAAVYSRRPDPDKSPALPRT